MDSQNIITMLLVTFPVFLWMIKNPVKHLAICYIENAMFMFEHTCRPLMFYYALWQQNIIHTSFSKISNLLN